MSRQLSEANVRLQSLELNKHSSFDKQVEHFEI